MNRAVAYVVSAFVALTGLPVLADETGCELRVEAIVASNSGRPEKDMIAFQKKWQDVFPFDSYKMVKGETKSARWHSRVGFDIPGGRYLVISPRKVVRDRIYLKILLLDGSRPVVDTVLALKNSGTVLLGGHKHAEGVLLLSVGAKTEP